MVKLFKKIHKASLIIILIQLCLSQNNSVFANTGNLNIGTKSAQETKVFTPKEMLITFLEAYNHPDKSKLQAFTKAYAAETKDNLNRIYYDFGPLELISIEKQTDDYIAVWLKGTISQGWTELELTLNKTKNGINAISAAYGNRPQDIEFPKLTKAELKAHLDTYFQNLEAYDLFSGSVLIMQKGRTIFDGAYGMANRETSVKNTSYTAYQIADISKLFTMVAIAQLDEQGKLSIPEPITTHLPDYPEQMHVTVTYQHFLAHTSGISLDHIKDYQTALTKTTNLEDLLKTQLKYINQIKNFNNWTPKESFDYSDEGYDLLALIVERASGMPYEDYLEQYIFRPAQMYNSGPYIYNPNKKDQAIGNTYNAPLDQNLNSSKWIDNIAFLGAYPRPAIGYKSTILDLYKFISAASNGTLINKTSWEKLSKETSIIKNLPYLYKGYGLGLARENAFNTGLSLGHNGNTSGVSSSLKYFPVSETVVVILSNNDNGSLNPDAYIRDLLANMKLR